MKKNRAVITGVSSFVGMHLASTFSNVGWDVTGIISKPFESAESACWFSGIQVLAQNISMTDLIERLQSKGIGTRSFWKPMHDQAPFKDALVTTMETTESLWRTVLTLPCSTNLSDDEQSQVVAAVKGCL
jgi:perosamine synthetase